MPISDDVRAAARQRAEEMTATNWYKLKGGQGEAIENTFRILRTPPTKTYKYPWYEYGLHRDVGPFKKIVRCGKEYPSIKGECYLCDVYIPKLKAQGKVASAKALAPRAMFLIQVADVKIKDDDTMIFKGPYLFTPPKTIASSLLSDIISGGRGGKRDYLDPENGFNITLPRTGTGKTDTTYGIMQVDPEPSAVPESIVKKLKPFDQLEEIPMYSEGKQKAAIQGIEEPRGGSVDDGDAPPARSRRAQPAAEEEDDAPPARSSRRPAPDEDKDDEGDEDDAPAPRRTSRADDDDDAPRPRLTRPTDDEDDAPPARPRLVKPAAEDEEDEAPAHRSRRATAPVEEEDDVPPPSPRRPAAPVEEEDDEPAPAPRRRAAAPPPEEEEDDAPPPPPRRAAAAPASKPAVKAGKARK